MVKHQRNIYFKLTPEALDHRIELFIIFFNKKDKAKVNKYPLTIMEKMFGEF